MKIYITLLAILSFISLPLKAEKTTDFFNELYELDPITAFIPHPQAEQKIKGTIELELDLKAAEPDSDELAKAWDAFNHQKQSEYFSKLGFPNNN